MYLVLYSGIAVADVLVMLEYIPFIVHNNLLDEVTYKLLKSLLRFNECFI